MKKFNGRNNAQALEKGGIALWRPDVKWLLKSLAVIFVLIVILYFSLNILLKPYIRTDIGNSKFFNFIRVI